ncbi:MAG: hypothetical protein LUD03_01380, partial [Firmicutes bacterium]|nr:hypothetical protein [Bacillota bacterium]
MGSGGPGATYGYSASDITINGGAVTAKGGDYAAGIGGGNRGDGSSIKITGGTVNATAGIKAAGIGGGNNANGSDITINGGEVTATGGTEAENGGAGNGGGDNTKAAANTKSAHSEPPT